MQETRHESIAASRDVISSVASWARERALPVSAGLGAIMLFAIAFRTSYRAPSAPSYDQVRPGAEAVRSADGPAEAMQGAEGSGDAQVVRKIDWRPPPAFVKGIYISAAAAGSKKMFAGLVNLADRTEINSLVIDIKEGGGELAFIPDDPDLVPFASSRPSLGKISDFTAPLRAKGIYLIARLFVFQDPSLVAKRPEVAVKSKATGTVWRDRKGTPWIDAADQVAWDYTVKVAREAYLGGFDEVQLDYVRFPSDGVMSDIKYPVYDGKRPKAEVLGDFFAYFDDAFRSTGLVTSADLFGLVMWQHEYDLNIGQKLSTAAPHFDFISPMVYPSHYPPGFDGHPNPADFPYEVIYRNLVRGQPLLDGLKKADPERRIASIRPWIQDFDLGADYDAAKVRAQMKAAVDGGASGWLIWNARNVYTEAALEPEPAPVAAEAAQQGS